MLFSYFVAHRLLHSASHDCKHRASKLAIKISTAGVAVGLAIMIISICVVKGFQNELRTKLSGFTAHMEVLDFKSFSSPESYPISTPQSIVNKVKNIPGIKHVERVSLKMGILKTNDAFQNVVLKGVGNDYDLSFIKSQIKRGRYPALTDTAIGSSEILISTVQARELNLDIGQKVYAYFFSDDIRMRRFTVVGIYETNFEQFDDYFVWTDRTTVNRLNAWKSDESSALEIYVDNFNYKLNESDPIQKHLDQMLKGMTDRNGATYNIMTVKENPRTASVIQWVSLLDLNVWIILGLMGTVAGFTMVSGLLILILERTQTIGVLKALGATNARIRRIFIFYASLIVVRGLIWGNIIGLGVVLVQLKWGLIKLDPASYHVAIAPISINPWWIVGLNISTLALCILTIILPSFVISRIRPSRSIRFE